jgi:hypothetical protein
LGDEVLKMLPGYDKSVKKRKKKKKREQEKNIEKTKNKTKNKKLVVVEPSPSIQWRCLWPYMR